MQVSLNPVARRAVGLASVGLFLFGGVTSGQEVMPQPTRVPGPASIVTAPDPQRVFRLEGEPVLMERMARESKEGINPLKLRYEFVPPPYPTTPPPPFVPRFWEPMTERVEPAYLCYGRLQFEQLNSERYGWSLGPLHPVISAGIFFFDVAALPYNAATDPLRCYECNTGYLLPGTPVPLLLYLPQPSLTGALAEAAAIGLIFVIFP
jgi:hypothetical protein